MAKNKNGQVVKLKAQVKELKSELKSVNKSRKAWFKLATKAGGLLSVIVDGKKTAKAPRKLSKKKAVVKKRPAKVEEE